MFSSKCNKNVIIAVGHSHWFRKFCQEFVSGKYVYKKIQNCGVIAFKLTCKPQQDGTTTYSIKPTEITCIYSGFL